MTESSPGGQSTSTLSPIAGVLFTLAFLGAGLLLEAVAAGLLPTQSSGEDAPRAVLALAGLVFLAAAGAPYAAHRGPNSPASAVVGVTVLVSMAAVGHWVAFGPGPRHFAGTFVVGGLAVGGLAPGELVGRAVFGVGALLLDVAIASAVRQWWRARRPGAKAGGH